MLFRSASYLCAHAAYPHLERAQGSLILLTSAAGVEGSPYLPAYGVAKAAQRGLAKSLARAMHGTVPVVAGAGLTTPIAYRWKTQINENAKMPAHALELPEMDHNEIEGWSSGGELARFSAVFLDDDDTHPRVKERIELTSRLIRPGAAGIYRVQDRKSVV